MRPTKIILLLLLFILSFSGCTKTEKTHTTKSSFDLIKQSNVIRVGYIVYPPIVTKDAASGELGGHFVWTMKEIADQSGWKIEFIETDWSNFSVGLNTKRFDVSIAPTFTTIPRLKNIAFSTPLLFAGNSAVAKYNDSRFVTIDALNSPKITIAVTQGEAGHEYAKTKLSKAILIVHTGTDQLLTFQDVLTGRADIALGDAYVTSKFASLHPEKVQDVFAKEPYNLTPVSWAVRYSDHELLSFLNGAISVMEIQGKLKEFEERAGANWLHLEKNWILEK